MANEHEPTSPMNVDEHTIVEERPRVADPSELTPEDERVQQMMAHTIDVGALAGAVNLQAAADAADTLEELEEGEATEVLEEMEDLAAAEALAEMQMPLAVSVLQDLVDDDPVYAGRLLGLMAPDDATDILQGLDEKERDALLARVERSSAEEIVQLINYDPESAGGLMTTNFLVLRDDMSVGQATEYIRSSPVPDSVNDALVTDDHDRLTGLISLRQLLLAPNSQQIADIMETDLVAIRTDRDREEVAQTFDRYDLSLLPVIDDHERLLGVITVDDVIDIIREEQTEDVQRSVGAGKGEAVYSSLRDKIKGRLGWLATSLVMMCFSAAIILFNEDIIRKKPLLAFLLPVIAAVVGNGGQQSMMVTLRGLVLDEIRPGRVGPLLGREVMVGIVNGLALGMLLFAGVVAVSTLGLETATLEIAIVAGIAIFGAMSAATLTGTTIPLLMKKLGIDPALAASIILIMITDGVSFMTIIGLTKLMLG